MAIAVETVPAALNSSRLPNRTSLFWLPSQVDATVLKITLSFYGIYGIPVQLTLLEQGWNWTFQLFKCLGLRIGCFSVGQSDLCYVR